MHTVSKELFNKFKARAGRAFVTEGAIDERISFLCRAINEYPGASTVWSCSGHTYDENNSRFAEARSVTGDNNLRIRGASTRWYLTFVTTDECEGLIERISDVIFNQPRETRLQFNPCLHMTTLGNFFEEDGSFYKSWSIEGMFRDNPESIQELSKLWCDIAASIKAGEL